MNLLRRELAPIPDAAWAEIDAEARRVLTLSLGGRKLVDFDGPHGWDFAAANPGTMEEVKNHGVPDAEVWRRQTQPLVEVRIPFTLSLRELDAVVRGQHEPDLDPLVEAAETMARLENAALFHGRDALGITGILEASENPAVELPGDPARVPRAVVEASEILRQAGINGPYALALGPDAYTELAQAAEDGYPIRRRVEELVSGPLVWTPGLEGAALLSVRGGDFQLTVGQDLAVGYTSHTGSEVNLYLVQSFTFRVLDPAAAVALSPAGE